MVTGVSRVERISWVLGIVLAVITLLASTWTLAVYVSDMQHQLVSVTEKVTHTNDLLVEGGIAQDVLFQNQGVMMKGMLTFVYMNENYMLVKTSDGRTAELPVLSSEGSLPEIN